MRQDYTEVTDVREYEMGDGGMLVVERHRRRRWFLPSPSGEGWRGAPLAMAAIWLLGGTAGLVASAMVYGAVQRGIDAAYAQRQRLLQQLEKGQPVMGPKGVITIPDKNGKPHDYAPGDADYPNAQRYYEYYESLPAQRDAPPATVPGLPHNQGGQGTPPAESPRLTNPPPTDH